MRILLSKLPTWQKINLFLSVKTFRGKHLQAKKTYDKERPKKNRTKRNNEPIEKKSGFVKCVIPKFRDRFQIEVGKDP